jgi:hypothetical protein
MRSLVLTKRVLSFMMAVNAYWRVVCGGQTWQAKKRCRTESDVVAVKMRYRRSRTSSSDTYEHELAIDTRGTTDRKGHLVYLSIDEKVPELSNSPAAHLAQGRQVGVALQRVTWQ